MLCQRSLLRLCSAPHLRLLPVPTPVQYRRSAVTFVTVAPNQQRVSPPAGAGANPTRPGRDNKIFYRAQQLANHFSHAKRIARIDMAYTTRKIAAANTLEHRVYIEKDGQLVSPWHDIPLYANEQQTVLNMVVEVPRWTNAKMEVRAPQLMLNPARRCVY
jgi:inorganic pyrophosphatase